MLTLLFILFTAQVIVMLAAAILWLYPIIVEWLEDRAFKQIDKYAHNKEVV